MRGAGKLEADAVMRGLTASGGGGALWVFACRLGTACRAFQP